MANEFTFKVTDNITSKIKRIQKELDNLPQEVYQEFKKNTPIRSGNARRNTKLKGNEIEAKYPYAKKLDEGYSKQSPDGMTKPTEQFMKKRLKEIMKRGRK
jgi:hypothetical protein